MNDKLPNMNPFVKRWNTKKKSILFFFLNEKKILFKLNFFSPSSSYRLNFEKLKNLKTQIEHAQYLVEKTSVKLQKDFDAWWNEQCEIIEAKNKQNEAANIVTSTSRTINKIDSASSIASSIQSINSSVLQSQSNSRPSSSLNSTALSQSYYTTVGQS